MDKDILRSYNTMILHEVKGKQVNRVINKIKSLNKWNDEDLEEDWMIKELAKSIGVVLSDVEIKQIHDRYEHEMNKKYKRRK